MERSTETPYRGAPVGTPKDPWLGLVPNRVVPATFGFRRGRATARSIELLGAESINADQPTRAERQDRTGVCVLVWRNSHRESGPRGYWQSWSCWALLHSPWSSWRSGSRTLACSGRADRPSSRWTFHTGNLGRAPFAPSPCPS